MCCDQAEQGPGAPPLLLDQRLGLDLRRPGDCRLGHGQVAGGDDEHHDHDQEDDVLAPEVVGTRPRPMRRQSTIRSAGGLGDAWSQQLALLGLHEPRPRRARRGPCRAGAAGRARPGGRARPRRCRRAQERCGGRRPGRSPRRRAGSGASSGSGVEPGPVPPESGDRPLSAGSSSMGKARTSVGPSLPRKREFRSAMAASSTNRSDTSVSPRTPSSARTASASLIQRRVSTGWADCSSAAKTDRAHGSARLSVQAGPSRRRFVRPGIGRPRPWTLRPACSAAS